MSEALTPAQETQMEADLARLLPGGPPAMPPLGQSGHRLSGPARVDFGAPLNQGARAIWHWRRYPMGGWVHWCSPAWMQRIDQGQDGEIPLGRHIIAPGWGKCTHHLSDREFPGGFGSPYAVVYIGSGRFGGKLLYLGHCNADVIPAGETFHTGRILARPNHSLNAGRGWFEIGLAPNGYPGRMGSGAIIHPLFTPAWKWSRS